MLVINQNKSFFLSAIAELKPHHRTSECRNSFSELLEY